MKYKIKITGKYEYFDLDYEYEFILNRKPKKNYIKNTIKHFTEEIGLFSRLITKSIKINIEEFQEEFYFDYII